MSKSAAPNATLANLALPMYVLALLFMLMPLTDLMLNLPNFEPSNGRWRFGVVGLLTNALLLPMTGLFMFLATALIARHRWAYNTGQVIGAIALLSMVVFFVIFALDSVQIRGAVNPELLRRFDITIVKTLGLQLVQISTIVVFMWTSRRVGRTLFPKDSKAVREGSLVMGAETAAG
jgi:hypothetical protein